MCVAAKPICKNCDLFILDICPLQFSPKRTLRKMQKPNLPKPIDMCCILWGWDSSTKGQNLLKLKSCCSHPIQPLILLSQGCLALIQLTDKSKVLPPVTNQSQATPSNKRWRQILAPKDKIWRCEANWSFNLIQARRPCINFSHRQKPLSPGITHKQLSQTEAADESMWEGFWCWRRMLIGSKPDWDQNLRPDLRTRF